MRIVFAFGGYFLVPLLVALVFRGLKVRWVYLSYFITAFVLYFYPDIQRELYDSIYPPEPVPDKHPFRCGTGYAMMEMVNIFFFIPGTMLIQALFNYLFTHSFFYRRTYEKISP